jgi:hypothetical protein
MDFGVEYSIRRHLPAYSWRGEKTSAALVQASADKTDRPIASVRPRQPRLARAALHQPHTSFSLYAGQDFVEVLTKCRVQHLWRGDVRFVAAGGLRQQGDWFGTCPRRGLSGQTPRQLAIGNAGGFPHVGCAAINNRSRNNNSARFSPRTHRPSGQERRPRRADAARPSKAREASR